MKSFLVVMVAFFFVSNSFACLEIRAALDIGSGETKMKVAKVDYCQKKIIEFIVDGDEGRRVVLYKNDLRRPNSDGGFSPEVMREGLKSLQELKEVALRKGATSFKAVATAAWREARNGVSYAAQIKSSLGINVQIINQNEEAQIGLYGALAELGNSIPHERVVVWDIGGGSMQIMTLNQTRFTSSLVEMGAIPFRDFLRKEARLPTGTGSLNPMSLVLNMSLEETLRRTRQLSTSLVRSQEIREKIRHPSTVVVGIGGMHFNGVRDALGVRMRSPDYDQKMLKAAVAEQYEFTDQEVVESLPVVARPYYAEQVSNMVLILGFMQELGIPRVTRLKVTLANGLLIM